MTNQTAKLGEKINEHYDAVMFRPGLIRYYGGSDYTNFGFWTEGTRDAKAACDGLMEQLLSFISERSGKVLDVACGKGETSRYLSRYYAPEQITGINISEKQLGRARELVPGGTFRVMDATALDFEDASFDAVVCVEAAFHFNTRERFLKEALRVLKPGGMLVLSDILVLQDTDKSHERRVSENYVENLDAYKALYARAGFASCEIVDATENSWKSHYRDVVRYLHDSFLNHEITLDALRGSLEPYYERVGFIRYYLLAGARKA